MIQQESPASFKPSKRSGKRTRIGASVSYYATWPPGPTQRRMLSGTSKTMFWLPKRSDTWRTRTSLEPRLRDSGSAQEQLATDDIRSFCSSSAVRGHLDAGAFSEIFLRNEMNEDLVLVPARAGQKADDSEYEEVLPVAPP